MKYTSRNPNGINQVASSSVAISVLNTDVAVFTTGSLELDGALTSSNALITGNVVVLGTASINTLVVNQTQYTSGSNQFGDGIEDTQTLFGTVRIPTGSFNVTGSSIMSGSLNVTGGITGSFSGSGTIESASFASTASYVNPLVQDVLITGSTFISSSNGTQLQVGNNSLFVSSSGNVGIGTTSPLYRLDAIGSNFRFSRGSTVDLDIANTGLFRILRLSAGTSDVVIQNLGSYDIGFNNNFSRVMTLNPTGNVGIGTTTPTSRLQVKGSGTTSATTAFRVENANASASLVVLDNGNVGIGTTTPTTTLDVGGGVNFSMDSGTFLNFTNDFPNWQITDNDATFTIFLQASRTGTYRLRNGDNFKSTFFIQNRSGSLFARGTSVYPGLVAGSALLELRSTTEGFLITRTSDTSNIPTPLQGLITYLTGSTNEGLYYYNSGSYQGWTKVLNSSGSQSISGNLTVTGSLIADTATLTSFTASNATISGNVTVLGTASINTLIVNQTQLSTGSNQLGDAANDTQTLYGTVVIPTGSLTVTGSSIMSGSLNVTGSGFILNPANNTAGLSIVSPPTAGGSLVLSIIGGPGINNGAYLILRQSDGTFPNPTSTGAARIISTQDSQYFNGTSYITSTKIVDISEGQKIFGVTPSFGGTLTYYGKLSNGNWYFGDLSSTINTARDTSVNARVQIKGSGTTSSTTAFRVENANASGSMVVLDNGFVGINTGSAQYNLDVNGTTRFNGLSIIQGTTASDTAPLGTELLTTGTGDASWTGADFATGYTHVTGSTTTLTSTLAGVVNTYYQITYTVTGRTAGSFTVAFGGFTSGNLTATGAVGPRATTTDSVVITPTSDFNGTIVLSIKVINTSSASVTLNNSSGTVTNQIRISNLNSNTFIGLNAGSRNTTGTSNTANGGNALQSNTTGANNTANGFGALQSNTTGNNNTANGFSALLSNTTGGSNTANGYFALRNNTTGVSNTANGFGALQSNTTGGFNTANGVGALQNNTTGNNNTANGYLALQNNTTGTSNTANGVGALQNNTTGVQNTANGINALSNNTTGFQNTAIGVNALVNNTTGTENTANGVFALQNNTTGVRNTANGFDALRSNTTGISNVANGFQALRNNTTANDNTAVGREALFENTSGGSNTAIGRSSMLNNSTGNNNTAVGGSTLLSNTTGASNTVIGRQALQNNTTGNNNTANGVLALFSNTTGSFNTANGVNAGRFIAGGITANTITNNSVFIGADTKALADNQTNQIVIGHNATGIGSNTAVLGNDSIVTTALKGNVGIGTTAPSARLQVKGSGTTSATTAFRVENANTSGSMVVLDDGNVGIGTTAPSATLEVNGPAKVNSLLTVSTPAGGNTVVGRFIGVNAASTPFLELRNIGVINAQIGGLNGGGLLLNTGTTERMRITAAGNVGIGTTTPSASLQVNGDTILSSSLYSSRQSSSLNAGDTLLYQVDTGSYTAGFFDYYATSGSNGRAGTIMSFWLGGQVQYTDNSTPDVGDTSNIAFSMSLSASSAQLFASASSDSWTVKTSFRTF